MRPIIQSAVFKLTLWYLGIIVMLSLLFSLAIYRISYDQLAETAARQQLQVARLPLPIGLEPRRAEFTQAIADQLDEGRNHLLARLTLLNFITLMGGGGAAYVLARRTLRPVQDSLEAQGRFTADASHELRTPLTAMRAEIEVAMRDKHLSAADARELLESNLEEIGKLEDLSTGLLRLARFETGLDASGLERVTVQEMFEGAVDRFHSRINERHLELEMSGGTQTVEGDRASLIELVAVLLDNAIKYSPEGSTIKLQSQLAGHTVRLSVSDQGVGIKPADIPHIFDRFYRADRSRTKDGYGLGLSIAKRISDLHHGVITVESTPQKGSTFTVRIPAQYAVKKSFLPF